MTQRPMQAMRTTLLLVSLLCGMSAPATAQVPSADSLEQWIRRGYSLSASNGQTPDVTKEVREVWGELGWSGTGYGFRTLSARAAEPNPDTDKGIQSFAALMEYFMITLDELHTAVIGDIGLAWGVHTEKFKMKNQPSEIVRVRFTNTLRWDGTRWKNLLYHRDAQLFDQKGFYIRTPLP